MLLVGRLVSYMVIPLFAVMVYEILVRKLFTAPTLWAYDISRMLYGAFFMLGSAYALMRGVHIRADFIYRNWTARVQGGIDTLLYVVLYFPGLIFFPLHFHRIRLGGVAARRAGFGHGLDAVCRSGAHFPAVRHSSAHHPRCVGNYKELVRLHP